MFDRFRQRSYELERLDTGDFTPEEYGRWEREMPWIHGFFGEKRALRNSLVRDIRYRGLTKVSIVDIGAGSGGILKIICELLPRISVMPVAVEMSDQALKTVRDAASATGIRPVKADALELPFDDGSLDYAICTLLMHHLADADAERLVSEMNRVARYNFYIVDLHRHPVGYYLYRLFSPLFLQRFTQEDGALSILRSFTAPEMLRIASLSGVNNAKVEHSTANRLILSRR